MNETAIVTIVSNNYLHYARTLMQSVAQCHPDFGRYCVIVDTDLSYAKALCGEFETIAIADLALPCGDEFTFQYNVLELNTAVKPWALESLLARGYANVIYIDPDIKLYQPMAEVLMLLANEADLVLTPHLLEPIADKQCPSELDIRRAGTYNLGFCAIRSSNNAMNFLRWWQAKLTHDCVIAPDQGIFVDQSWVDLAPGLFPNVAILRHHGYNVAYWNIAQRHIILDEGLPSVCGQPMRFFHFSGLSPLAPQNFSKHQNRFILDDLPDFAKSLVLEYCAAVKANGISLYSAIPYGFGFYTKGDPILDAHRALFRSSASLRSRCGGQPYSCADLIANAATCAEQRLDVQCGAQANSQLMRIFKILLGRQPDAAAILVYGQLCESLLGRVRTLLAVGLSAEARAKAGWGWRLLHFVATSQSLPAWCSQYLLQPFFKIIKNKPSMLWPDVATEAVRSPTPGVSDCAATAHRRKRSFVAISTPVQPHPPPPGLNLVGYIAGEQGLGEAVRSLARACAAADVPFSTIDVGYQSQNLQRDTSILDMGGRERNFIDLLYVNADQTPATAAKLKSEQHFSDYTIGFWHWEQTAFPARWMGAFDLVDEVWVPSTFVHDAVAAVAPVPVVKIPHAIQFQPNANILRRDFGLPANKLIALLMFDFNSYQYRKNPQAAIAAFRLAARTRSNLFLVIKTINSQQHLQAYAELCDGVKDFVNVIIIDQYFTRQQVWDLQHCCDVLISLHRAEGFGLAPAEMMYLGKPVIATGWSANMDFMTADNSFPVRYQLEPLAHDVGAYPAGPVWAEADIDHAAWCLGQIADNPDLALRVGQQAAHDIQVKLSPVAVGRLVRERLQVLGQWYPRLLSSSTLKAPR